MIISGRHVLQLIFCTDETFLFHIVNSLIPVALKNFVLEGVSRCLFSSFEALLLSFLVVAFKLAESVIFCLFCMARAVPCLHTPF